MIQCVFIIRLDPIILFALFRIELIIKISFIEHILLPIHSHRHSLIPTSKYIPSTHILIRCLITENLIAFCAVVTVKILDRLPQSIKKFFIIRFHSQITIDQRKTRTVGRPRRQFLQKLSGIRIIQHCHIRICIIDVIYQQIDILYRTKRFA